MKISGFSEFIPAFLSGVLETVFVLFVAVGVFPLFFVAVVVLYEYHTDRFFVLQKYNTNRDRCRI